MSGHFPKELLSQMRNHPSDQMQRWVEEESHWNEEVGESITGANHEREAKEDRMHEDVAGTSS